MARRQTTYTFDDRTEAEDFIEFAENNGFKFKPISGGYTVYKGRRRMHHIYSNMELTLGDCNELFDVLEAYIKNKKKSTNRKSRATA